MTSAQDDRLTNGPRSSHTEGMGQASGDVGGDVIGVSIRRGETTSTEYVVSLGGNRYRLDSTPLFVEWDDEVWPGDIIDLEPGENGVLLFRGIVSKSPWRHLVWAPGRHKAAFEAFSDALETAGAKWEHFIGGSFYVHLPPDSEFDLDSEWEDCLRRFPAEEPRKEPLELFQAYVRYLENPTASGKLDMLGL
jgi:hypothetical protein